MADEWVDVSSEWADVSDQWVDVSTEPTKTSWTESLGRGFAGNVPHLVRQLGGLLALSSPLIGEEFNKRAQDYATQQEEQLDIPGLREQDYAQYIAKNAASGAVPLAVGAATGPFAPAIFGGMGYLDRYGRVRANNYGTGKSDLEAGLAATGQAAVDATMGKVFSKIVGPAANLLERVGGLFVGAPLVAEEQTVINAALDAALTGQLDVNQLKERMIDTVPETILSMAPFSVVGHGSSAGKRQAERNKVRADAKRVKEQVLGQQVVPPEGLTTKPIWIQPEKLPADYRLDSELPIVQPKGPAPELPLIEQPIHNPIAPQEQTQRANLLSDLRTMTKELPRPTMYDAYGRAVMGPELINPLVRPRGIMSLGESRNAPEGGGLMTPPEIPGERATLALNTVIDISKAPAVVAPENIGQSNIPVSATKETVPLERIVKHKEQLAAQQQTFPKPLIGEPTERAAPTERTTLHIAQGKPLNLRPAKEPQVILAAPSNPRPPEPQVLQLSEPIPEGPAVTQKQLREGVKDMRKQLAPKYRKVMAKDTFPRPAAMEPQEPPPAPPTLQTPPPPPAPSSSVVTPTSPLLGNVQSRFTQVGTKKAISGEELPVYRNGYIKKGETIQNVELTNVKANVDPEWGVTNKERLSSIKDYDVDTEPVHVFEHRDGRLEIASGRHKGFILNNTDSDALASAVLYREVDGWTRQMMRDLDFDANIKAKTLSAEESAPFFRQHRFGEEAANERGYLTNAANRDGYAIGTYASNELYHAWQVKNIGTKDAKQIAEHAPDDVGLQAVGLDTLRQTGDLKQAIFNMDLAEMGEPPPASHGPTQTDIGGTGGDSIGRMREAKAAIAKILAEAAYDYENAVKSVQLNKRSQASRADELTPSIKGRAEVEAAQAEIDIKTSREAAKLINNLKSFPDKFKQVQEVFYAGGEAALKALLRDPEFVRVPREGDKRKASSGAQIMFGPFQSETGALMVVNPIEAYKQIRDMVANRPRERKLTGSQQLFEATDMPVAVRHVIKLWRNHNMYPRTLARFGKNGERVYDIGRGYIDRMNETLTKVVPLVKPFFRASKESQNRIWAVMSGIKDANLTILMNQIQGSGKVLPREQTDYTAYGLTPKEAEIAKNLRRTFDDALENTRKVFLREAEKVQDPEARELFRADVNEWIDAQYLTQYVPSSRLENKFSVVVKDDKGKVLYNAHHKTKAAAQKDAYAAQKEFKRKATIAELAEQIPDAFGVMPADMLPAAQLFDADKWTELAKQRPVTGFAKHLIHATGTPGYDVDGRRVVSDYLGDQAQWMSRKQFADERKELMKALQATGEAHLAKHANRYFDSIDKSIDPWVRKTEQLVHYWTLAGVPMSGFVNALAYPLLGGSLAAGELARMKNTGGVSGWAEGWAKALPTAPVLMAKNAAEGAAILSKLQKGIPLERIIDRGKMAFLQEQEAKGHLDMQILRDFVQARKGLDADRTSWDTLMWAFSVPEKFVHISSSLLGYDLGKLQGLQGEALHKYADNFHWRVAFDQSQANRPQWQTHNVTRLMSTYKNYGGNLMRFLRDNMNSQDWPVLALAMGGLYYLGGIFADPNIRAAKRVLESFGVDVTQAIRQYYNDDEFADGVMYGKGMELGYPITASLGAGDIVPGLDKYAGVGSVIAGPTAGMVTNAFKGIEAYRRYDNPLKAAQFIAPRFARNLLKAGELATTGQIRNLQGETIVSDPSISNILATAAGASTKEGTLFQEKKKSERIILDSVDNENINFRVAQAIYNQDDGTLDKLIQLAADKGLRVDERQVELDLLRFQDRDLATILQAPKQTRQQLMDLHSRTAR